MVCHPVMLTLALPWLCAAKYKDNIDNAKELFKYALNDKAMHSFQQPEPNTMPNVSLNDDDVDVQVCDNADMFGMVNISLPDQDIESKMSIILNTATPGDLANGAFKEWTSLKVD